MIAPKFPGDEHPRSGRVVRFMQRIGVPHVMACMMALWIGAFTAALVFGAPDNSYQFYAVMAMLCGISWQITTLRRN